MLDARLRRATTIIADAVVASADASQPSLLRESKPLLLGRDQSLGLMQLSLRRSDRRIGGHEMSVLDSRTVLKSFGKGIVAATFGLGMMIGFADAAPIAPRVCWDLGFSTRRVVNFKLLMERFVLTDARWAKMEPLCLGKPGDPGRSGKDNRRFVEAVLWIARTGSPWRDLPPTFGPWNSVFTRFRDWVRADVVWSAVRGRVRGSRHRIRHGRRHNRQSPCRHGQSAKRETRKPGHRALRKAA